MGLTATSAVHRRHLPQAEQPTTIWSATSSIPTEGTVKRFQFLAIIVNLVKENKNEDWVRDMPKYLTPSDVAVANGATTMMSDNDYTTGVERFERLCEVTERYESFLASWPALFDEFRRGILRRDRGPPRMTTLNSPRPDENNLYQPLADMKEREKQLNEQIRLKDLEINK
ncbi:hypothetical protein EMCG_03766 [[Emmonsia] crescens]|uniref:Uncharacterized protein n=1 Tax=[Emmonsia] crescens TaxID=73230 RepID=A0A0G2HU79_9EURO|nr:hypothetical protein EMCG_03766 [Emmonsia crescens UAMH 3008]